MTNSNKDRDKRSRLAEILTSLPEDQRKEAEERIEHYLALAAEVYEELLKNPVRLAEFLRRLGDQ